MHSAQCKYKITNRNRKCRRGKEREGTLVCLDTQHDFFFPLLCHVFKSFKTISFCEEYFFNANYFFFFFVLFSLLVFLFWCGVMEMMANKASEKNKRLYIIYYCYCFFIAFLYSSVLGAQLLSLSKHAFFSLHSIGLYHQGNEKGRLLSAKASCK